MTDYREQLKSIRTFPSLVRFLRDELDWPVETEDFEDLTFDYSPEELGIDAANAAKIEEIKKLRPLVANQPWGIFFVKFEPKQLPVVALRRILAGLAIKKRATASAAEQPKWAEDDLLFISNYGEGDKRQITFAHFSQPEAKQDLPTLKVLGWDNLDAPLHLDDVAENLTHNLAWPEDDRNVQAWRTKWSAAFTLRHREVIATSRQLSIRLAELARAIRDRIKTALAIETENGSLTKLMKAFQEALVHDLDGDGFADMYAQTIAYGLLSARITDPERKTADDFAAHMRTNPFLRELMEAFLKAGGRQGKAGGPGIDFDELGVSDVVDLLDNANMEAVIRDFGDRNPQEDPVIHFYELFLKEYDAKKRMRRGVFYTPRPVVSYIVRSVDSALRNELGLEDGLGDTTTWGEMARRHPNLKIPDGVATSDFFVQILDPAAGTGTFLVEAIDLIHRRMMAKWRSQGHGDAVDVLWNEYVANDLLPRLHGYEILMAPYAIAHLKIGLKLSETGYRFGSDERARIYLTNSLEPPSEFSGQLELDMPALAHEAKAVNDVKRRRHFTAIFGNPPYSDASQNLGPQFAPLIERFRFFEGVRIRERGAIRFEHAINNDYVKFWGLAIQRLEAVPIGVIGLITSSSFLEGKSFRGLRERMLEGFDRVQLTDLHGKGWSDHLAQAGIRDENVFEIQTGVVVTVLIKPGVATMASRCLYGELIGSYKDKAAVLGDADAPIEHVAVNLDSRNYLSFVPSGAEPHDEYWKFPQVDSFFVSSVDGIKTSRDGLVIANSRQDCGQQILRFSESTADAREIEEEFRFRTHHFDVDRARRHIRATFDEALIVPIAYRPLDVRYIYYDRELILSHRMNLMPRMLGTASLALAFASRLSSGGFDHVVATDTLCSNKYASHDINSRLFPIVGYEAGRLEGDGLYSNVRDEVLDQALVDGSRTPVERAMLFGAYVYGIAQAPSYRARYAHEISQDFPRIPLPKTVEVLSEIATLGERLELLHCLRIDVPTSEFGFSGVEGGDLRAPRWKDNALWIGEASSIANVGKEVWEFRMCGYQVCRSWFSAGGKVGLERQGTPITTTLVDEFRKVLWAVRETIRLRALLDNVIDEHGGWPDAFVESTRHAHV